MQLTHHYFKRQCRLIFSIWKTLLLFHRILLLEYDPGLLILISVLWVILCYVLTRTVFGRNVNKISRAWLKRWKYSLAIVSVTCHQFSLFLHHGAIFPPITKCCSPAESVEILLHVSFSLFLWRSFLTLLRSITWPLLSWLNICLSCITAVAMGAAARSETPCLSHAAANVEDGIRNCFFFSEFWSLFAILFHYLIQFWLSQYHVDSAEHNGEVSQRFKDLFQLIRFCRTTVPATSPNNDHFLIVLDLSKILY